MCERAKELQAKLEKLPKQRVVMPEEEDLIDKACVYRDGLGKWKTIRELLFKQEIMRDHVMKCLQEQNITMFPVKKTRRAAQKVKSVTDLHVFCKCRMPEVPGSTMIP